MTDAVVLRGQLPNVVLLKPVVPYPPWRHVAILGPEHPVAALPADVLQHHRRQRPAQQARLVGQILDEGVRRLPRCLVRLEAREDGVGNGGRGEDEPLATAGVVRHEVHPLGAGEDAVAARGEEEGDDEGCEAERDEEEHGAREKEVCVRDEAAGEEEDAGDDGDGDEGGGEVARPFFCVPAEKAFEVEKTEVQDCSASVAVFG